MERYRAVEVNYWYRRINIKERTMKSVKLAVCLLTLSLMVAGCDRTERAQTAHDDQVAVPGAYVQEKIGV